MEHVEIRINKPDEWDEVLSTSVQDHGDLKIITKHGVMQSGAAGVMFTFTVRLPDGTDITVQTVTSMRMVRNMIGAITRCYTEEGFPEEGVGGASAFEDPIISEG